MICNTDALTVLLWLTILLLLLLADFNLNNVEKQDCRTFQLIYYSKRNKLKMYLFSLVENNQSKEINPTQTSAKVLNDSMIPGTTSINQ